jgi:hypothetical protein
MLEKSKLLADFLRVPLLVDLSDPGRRSDATRKKSHNIRKDVKGHQRMLRACLFFAGAMLGVVSAGLWVAYWPGGQDGEAPRAQGLAVFITLFCVFASVVYMFVAYARLCWFYWCPKCGKRLKRSSSELGPIQYPCDSCKVLWDTGWETDIAD